MVIAKLWQLFLHTKLHAITKQRAPLESSTYWLSIDTKHFSQLPVGPEILRFENVSFSYFFSRIEIFTYEKCPLFDKKAKKRSWAAIENWSFEGIKIMQYTPESVYLTQFELRIPNPGLVFWWDNPLVRNKASKSFAITISERRK